MQFLKLPQFDEIPQNFPSMGQHVWELWRFVVLNPFLLQYLQLVDKIKKKIKLLEMG